MLSFECVQLASDVALVAVQKDVAADLTRRKLVLAFTLLTLVVSCDWGRPDQWVELDMTKMERKLEKMSKKKTSYLVLFNGI